MFKKILSVLLIIIMSMPMAVFANEPIALSCESAILMDAKTGTVIFEKNADTPLPPASITKVMTMLIIMEEINAGKLNYNDIVTASSRAKSMGGSTIFLDDGEKMSVYDLLKGIAVASANDACVAMAEHISGSVEAFVQRMNEKAKSLGMKNTNFINTNGLDADGHVSSARDVAIMSAELLKYEEIFNFTTIWTDSLRNGEFGLANTNKLIRFYEGATGLKTGSTDKAGCSVSATAKRDGLHLIAVVMKAPTSNDRFADAKTLLNYGFANYHLWQNNDTEKKIGKVRVEKGASGEVGVRMESEMAALIKKSDKGGEELRIYLEESVKAPIKAGDILGRAVCLLGEKEISASNLVATDDVEKISLFSLYKNLICMLIGAK